VSRAGPDAGALPAGPLHRLAALVYDTLLLLAVLFLGTAMLLPLTGGESITSDHVGRWALLYRAFVGALIIVFFGVSWTSRGQTLGMMSWKIRIETREGLRLAWSCVVVRLGLGLALVVALAIGLWLLDRGATPLAKSAGALLLAPVALNWLWMLRGTSRLTLQDALSRTRVMRLP
jgi:uncharacterized RDD family membrane protein YckC